MALLATALAVLAVGGSGAASAASVGRRPCDIYGAARTPCVAAFSPTRSMYAAYRGPLYTLERGSDHRSRNIGVLPNGYADAATHTSFCAGTTCLFTKIFDQSENHNDLSLTQPQTYETHGQVRTVSFNYVDAMKLPTVLGGHQAYGMWFDGPPGGQAGANQGYRNDQTKGVPVGAEPESMYMVASGTHTSGNCCFDFGNVETDDTDDGNGTMDTIDLATTCWFPNGTSGMPNYTSLNPPGSRCHGKGPWVQADLENGVYMSDKGSPDPSYTGDPSEFVTAILKNNGRTRWSLKSGDAQLEPLHTRFAGPLPADGYSPMQKQGAIDLGTGGDLLGSGAGSFFEGVMVRGYSTDAVDKAIHSNIVAARYGKAAAAAAAPAGATSASGAAATGATTGSAATAPGAAAATTGATVTASTGLGGALPALGLALLMLAALHRVSVGSRAARTPVLGAAR